MHPFAVLGRIALFMLLLPFVCPLRAVAGDDVSIGLGGRVNVTPYKCYGAQRTPFPIVSYEGRYAYVRGYTAGLKLANLEFLEFSVFGEYDDTSFSASDSSDKRLRKLSDRYSGVAAGLEGRLLTPYGMLHASGSQDVMGHGKGQSIAMGYMHSLEYGDFEFIPAAGLRWSSGAYNDYYYGVSGSESRKSGLEAYEAGSGFSPYVGLTVDYGIADAWDAFCGGELVFLNSAVRNSPMVDRETTYGLTLGFSYTF
jgi:outer membrane protein